MHARHTDPIMAEAITEAIRTHPYYHPAITRLRIVADDRVPTMATSHQWVTHYNPATLKSWTPAERGAVLVHEVEHLLRDHHGRCRDRDPKAWNIAGDAEINQRLAGLPDGAVYPETLGMPRGRSAETYYAATNPQQQQDPNGESGDGSGQGDGSGAGTPGDGPACGSSAGGELQSHELGDAANPGAGAADDGAEARELVAREVTSGRHGTEPGDELREWAERELGIDRAAWYTALAAVAGDVAAPYGAPTRWVWPGRREAADMGGAMVPRWIGERPKVSVVIDTSGSITPNDLDMARAAGHYMSQVADVTFYGCDNRAKLYGPVLPDSIMGGGGTDMRVGIAMAIRNGARAVVVITDCETPWPDNDPGVPVIIGANPAATPYLHPGGYYCPPSWMTVVPIQAPDVQ